jgi:hypothetical protein
VTEETGLTVERLGAYLGAFDYLRNHISGIRY